MIFRINCFEHRLPALWGGFRKFSCFGNRSYLWSRNWYDGRDGSCDWNDMVFDF